MRPTNNPTSERELSPSAGTHKGVAALRLILDDLLPRWFVMTAIVSISLIALAGVTALLLLFFGY